VLGIFARLHYRDGKCGYLEDASRFIGYVRAVAVRYNPLRPLLTLLDAIEDKPQARAGYTF
jgi:N-acetylmuramate 1-kinase